MSNLRPIGVFDSGVGGLTVLREIRRQLPDEPVIYIADQAHVPYGSRPLEEVRQFSESIARFLINRSCKLVVVACNTASAAALHHLRATFPEIPFVGMEPAVKPAAETTQTGIVGVLATPATFQGTLYASLIERFARGVQIHQDTCSGLVGQIEAGNLDSIETRQILEKAIYPMLAHGVDTIVLGCTHYPFVIPMIEEIAGPQVRVIDPSPAVARQVRRVLSNLSQAGLLEQTSTPQDPARIPVQFFTTGKPAPLHALLPLLGLLYAEVNSLTWDSQENYLTENG